VPPFRTSPQLQIAPRQSRRSNTAGPARYLDALLVAASREGGGSAAKRGLGGHGFQKPCDGMRNARLNRDEAFSHAMIIVSSASVSSS
jgi:hypothetical protein